MNDFLRSMRPITITAVLTILLGGVYFLYSYFSIEQIPQAKKSLEEYAAVVIENCIDTSHKPSCFDKEIPKLMDYISMEDAFEVSAIVEETYPEYAFCHVLGHELSRTETNKDPSKWKDIIARCPIGRCDNGCMHGVFQERFNTESMTQVEIDALVPELRDVCEGMDAWARTSREKVNCYHSIGHLAMFIAGGDIYESINLCEQVFMELDSAYLQVCFSGNFMQLFQPLEPEDVALVKDIAPQTQEEAELFCASFEVPAKTKCHHLSWPLYREEIKTSEGFIEFCSYSTDMDINDRCYEMLFYIAARLLEFDVSKVTEFCAGMPDDKKAQCHIKASSEILESDYNFAEQAASLCEAADAYGVKDHCYSRIMHQSLELYHSGSKEIQYLCNALPEPWKTQCIKGK